MTQTSQAPGNLVMERVFAHPPEKVWRALTETSLLDEWLIGKNDFQPVVGHKFTFRAEPSPHWDGVVTGEVLAVEPQKRLAYTWESGLKFEVTWTLTPTDAGTSLRMEQSGFAPEQKGAFEGARFGWNRSLDALDAVLARA